MRPVEIQTTNNVCCTFDTKLGGGFLLKKIVTQTNFAACNNIISLSKNKNNLKRKQICRKIESWKANVSLRLMLELSSLSLRRRE